MAGFGQSKKKLLRTCLRLPHGAPSHDTCSRVFRHLDPQTFAGAFSRFAQAFARVETIRTAHNGASTSIARFFLLSTIAPASRMNDVARMHCSIENQLHRVRDADFAE